MDNFYGYSKLTIPVESILEVRICQDMWERIKWVTERRECSYSWVVRYAVFRFIKRVDPKKCFRYIGNPRFRSPFEGDPNERAWVRRRGAALVGAGAKHRHRLCLYGEDEQAIRYAAAYYRCTMTHLIRVALELHFERLYASMLKASLDKRALRPALGAPLVSGDGEMSYFQRAFWFWLGIRVYNGVEFHNIALEKKQIQFWRYGKMEYYGKRFCQIKTYIGGNRPNERK